MKAFYIPLLLLTAILGFSLWTGQYMAHCSQEWTQILERSDSAAQSENWDLAQEHLERVYASWEQQKTFFHTVLIHEELDDAQSLFAGAFAAAEEQDNEDFHILLAQLSVQLELLAETQAISIKNVL